MSRSILDHRDISRSYFFPRRCQFPSPLWVESADAVLACSRHLAPRGDLSIVHFHGNGEVVADYLDGFPEKITSLGCDLLLAEYRGYGMSSGEPQLGKMLDDVVRIVESAGHPPQRLVLFGRSVGSIFALEGATRFPEVAGLILESGIADPPERLLMRVDPGWMGLSAEEFTVAVNERLDHRRKMAAYRGPVLILHTLFDDLVDVTNAERLGAWAGGPVTLALFDRGSHNTILAENEERYFAAVAQHLARVRAALGTGGGGAAER
jgi:uncharacterized protein